MMNRRQALSLSAAGLLAACETTGMGGVGTPPGPSLNELARRKGMRFGSAVGVGPPGTVTGSLNDPRYRQVLAHECGVLVHENELKWYVLRPDLATYDYARADRVMDFAAQHGMGVRGHTLVWHHPRWFPGWIETHDYGARPAAEAERLVVEHINAVIGRYGDRIDSWDVVNETVDPATGGLRRTALSQHLGDQEIVDLAFHTARAAAPTAQLVYNDYMSWEAGHETHQAGVLRLLEGMKARGVPIDALGVQSHIGSGNTDDSVGFDTAREGNWRRFMDEVTGLGLDIVISEFDVHDKNLPADIPSRDRAVAELARRYLDLMFSYPQTKDVLAWGMVDSYSWLQGNWPRADGIAKRTTPYDADFQPKPLRQAIADAFMAAPAR